jgi:type IV pilus assembly protein PilQ
MRSLLKNQGKILMFVAVTTLVAAGSCTQRTKTTTVPTPPTAEQTASVQPTEQPSVLPIASLTPELNGPARLDEIRLIETGGQRSILFRFSRPPEGVDYFPLRNPSRLVIDVKGTVDPPAKIQTYKSLDAVVSGVRVGTYQGRMRLVVDLKNAIPPQFSVDSYETLITAFLGEKDVSKSATYSNAQVLFISENARALLVAGASGQSEKLTAAPSNGTAPSNTPEVPSDAATATNTPPSPVDSTQAQPPQMTPPLSEEKIATTPAATPTTDDESAPLPAVAPSTAAPLEIAQVAPSSIQEEPTGEAKKSGGSTKNTSQEAFPILAEEVLPIGPSASGEFRPALATQYTGRRISLDFKNADVHDVFRILADVSGLNIIATDDVKARVTLRLIEVPWDQALDVVLQANGLEKSRIGNVITISTTKRLEAERNARLLAQNAQQKLAPLETAYVRINYIKATDVVGIVTVEQEQRATGGAARPVAAGAAGPGGRTQIALMSPRGTIAADPTTNVVIIRDTSDRIAAIQELIRNVDVQTPQVVIESYLITTNESLNRDLGIQWGYSYKAGPATGNPTGVNFPGTVDLGGSGLGTGAGNVPFIADFPAATSAGSGSAIDLLLGSISGSQALALRLSALEREGKARVISRPRVVTINNKIAEIKSRRTVRVPVISDSLNVGGAGSTQGGGDAFEEFDVGITLKIIPQISSDGFVLLDVAAESSELAPASVTPSGPSSFFPIIPDTLLRTASSNVLIRAGDTFVLGGILSDNLRKEEEGTPYLRTMPGLGWLFRNNVNSRAKDELLVFITPKLVTGAPVAGLPTAQQLWENRSKGDEVLSATGNAARVEN